MTGTPDGKFTTRDGCIIAYTLHAHANPNAPRLALIHSLALDRSIWHGVVSELALHTSILTYDCRGHGRSSPVDMPYTAELFADDLAQLVDHLDWRTATVAGCSMGGCVAQAFAAKYPHRTQGACFIDTTAWYGADAPAKWRERAATAKAQGMGALIDFQVTRWFTDAFRAADVKTISALTKVFLANDVRCYERTCEMLGTEDLRPLLGSIKAPVAVVVGAEDYATPVSMAEALHQAIPRSTLTVIAQGRHITPAECPQDIASELKKLLKI